MTLFQVVCPNVVLLAISLFVRKCKQDVKDILFCPVPGILYVILHIPYTNSTLYTFKFLR